VGQQRVEHALSKDQGAFTSPTQRSSWNHCGPAIIATDMSKTTIAREWLIAIGCMFLGILITEVASYLQYRHFYSDFWSDLFDRHGDRTLALQALFGPLAIIELLRSVAWSIRTLRKP